MGVAGCGWDYAVELVTSLSPACALQNTWEARVGPGFGSDRLCMTCREAVTDEALLTSGTENRKGWERAG